MKKPTFRVGDIVRLKGGWTAKEVIAVVHSDDLKCGGYRIEYDKRSRAGHYLVTRYLHYADAQFDDDAVVRCAEDFIYWDGDDLSPEQENNRRHQQKDDETMTKLYQIIGAENRFGTFLATNSEGKIVLEMKGEGGAVASFTKDEIEEVKPYTYRCRVVGAQRAGRGPDYVNLEGEKGAVKKGDLIIRPSGTIYLVDTVNSRAKPTGKLCGTVIEGRVIEAPNSQDDENE